MEKIKFSNGDIFEILTSGVHSDDKVLSLAFIAPEKDLVTLETMLLDKNNVARIELLSAVDEVLKIYSGYVKLVSIEKKKDVVIAEDTKSDVIYITLKQLNETETRLSSLEETVDMLVMSALA